MEDDKSIGQSIEVAAKEVVGLPVPQEGRRNTRLLGKMEDDKSIGQSTEEVSAKDRTPTIVVKRKLPVPQESPRCKKKMFRQEWLDLEIMKDWLIPQTNSCKAKCLACNKVLNAGKSELLKHASGFKHEQNIQIMRSIGIGFTNEGAQSALDSITNSLEIERHSSPAARYEVAIMPTQTEAETQTAHTGSDSVQSIYREKQLEFLSRIASAVERIADSQELKTGLKHAADLIGPN